MGGCLLVFFAFLFPRILMFFIWLLTNWFSVAYETVIWPVLGFIFMPYTTLAYMTIMLQNNHEISGGWIVLLIVAVFFDLGTSGGTVNKY